MSLMDDVFDIKAKLKGTDEERAFDNVEKALWYFEEHMDQYKKENDQWDYFVELIKDKINETS